MEVEAGGSGGPLSLFMVEYEDWGVNREAGGQPGDGGPWAIAGTDPPMLLPAVCCLLCPCLFSWHLGVLAGGGDREDVALSYVYANSGCVAASWLCVL